MAQRCDCLLFLIVLGAFANARHGGDLKDKDGEVRASGTPTYRMLESYD